METNNETRNLEYEIWETSYKIDSIDKEYKFRDPETVKKGIINGAKALLLGAGLYMINQLDIMGGTIINILGSVDIALHLLLSSMYLGPNITYKFKKKKLEDKLSKLEEQKLNSQGIFTVDDFEIVLDANIEDINLENNQNQSSLLEGGGKHVR